MGILVFLVWLDLPRGAFGAGAVVFKVRLYTFGEPGTAPGSWSWYLATYPLAPIRTHLISSRINCLGDRQREERLTGLGDASPPARVGDQCDFGDRKERRAWL